MGNNFDQGPGWCLSRVRGQDRAVRQLQKTLANGRLAHAYLFAGPPGVGKKTTARAFAQTVLCAGPHGGDACQRCSSCRQFAGDNHPDFVWLAPAGTSVKIEQVRQMQKRIRFLPYVAKHQVVVLEQAETMQAPAANAMLKVLEEPVGPTVFILLTSRIQSLLPTIVSRCLPVYFSPVPGEEIARFLAGEGVTPNQVPLLTLLARGRWDQAAQLAANGLPPEREQARQLLDRLLKAGDAEIFGLGVEWDKKKAELASLLDYLALLLRDRLLLALRVAPELVIDRELAESQVWPPAVLLAALERVMVARRYLETNTSERVLLETVLLNLRDLALAGCEKGPGKGGGIAWSGL